MRSCAAVPSVCTLSYADGADIGRSGTFGTRYRVNGGRLALIGGRSARCYMRLHGSRCSSCGVCKRLHAAAAWRGRGARGALRKRLRKRGRLGRGGVCKRLHSAQVRRGAGTPVSTHGEARTWGRVLMRIRASACTYRGCARWGMVPRCSAMVCLLRQAGCVRRRQRQCDGYRLRRFMRCGVCGG